MEADPLQPTHIIAIGASAGGLEAITALLEHLPVLKRVALVVAQHLSPEHPSQLTELLQRTSQLPVVTAADGQPLRAAQVVVIPPNRDASFLNHALRLETPEPRFGPSPSLDRLFESLAETWGERGVAVLLSGTGSDGACGMRAVGAAGGLTLVQSPESARFDGMPRAAIALGAVDLVATPAALAGQLQAWFQAGSNETDADEAPLLLSSIAAQLKQSTGVDFSQYKESTLLRQLQRRMAIRNIKSSGEYLQLLSIDGEEAQLLLHNLLVNVTSFFRNPDAYAALGKYLEALIADHPSGERLRVWVPGCATGEEAYSIGMVVSEVMKHPVDLSQHLKIFATDLDEQSLATGRRGSYPISAAKNMPESLFHRFAVTQDNTFQISKELRSCVVFARHNVSEDPPFPSIDLISCRNALIYFTTPLQERVIDLFSFSLANGGLLFLGSSESLGRTNAFTVLSPLHRIYRRTAQVRSRSRLSLPRLMPQPALPQRSPTVAATTRESLPEQHIRLLEALARSVAEPCLVVDENHELVEVIGDVSAYCKIPEGRITAAVGAFLRDELQAEAKALLLLVRADRMIARSGSLRLADREDVIRLEAAPLQVGERALTVLSFIREGEHVTALGSALGASERDAAFSREIERLERELLSSQDSLRRSMADLEQANEELEASSEELQASSEELQSSNEELEASNEELQATNEELGGLNQQLRTRSDELERLNNDLENIQSSLSQGMVIVDRELRVTRFSPLAVRVFGLVESDIGRPLIGVPTTVPIPGLRENLEAIVSGTERRCIEATSEEAAYLAQIMPYRDRSGVHLGAIITLTDISELVALRRAAEASLREFTGLANALDQVVWKRDHNMHRTLYISRRIEALGGWSAEEICQHPDLLDSAIHPQDQAAVAAARRQPSKGWSVTYRLATRSRGVRLVQEVATRLNDGHDHGIVGTLSDITDQTRLDQRSLLLARGFEALTAAADTAMLVLDGELSVILANPAFAELAGCSEEPALSQALGQLRLVADPPAPESPAPASLHHLVRSQLMTLQPLRLASARIARDQQTLGRVALEILPLAEAAGGLGVIVRITPLPA